MPRDGLVHGRQNGHADHAPRFQKRCACSLLDALWENLHPLLQVVRASRVKVDELSTRASLRVNIKSEAERNIPSMHGSLPQRIGVHERNDPRILTEVRVCLSRAARLIRIHLKLCIFEHSPSLRPLEVSSRASPPKPAAELPGSWSLAIPRTVATHTCLNLLSRIILFFVSLEILRLFSCRLATPQFLDLQSCSFTLVVSYVTIRRLSFLLCLLFRSRLFQRCLFFWLGSTSTCAKLLAIVQLRQLSVSQLLDSRWPVFDVPGLFDLITKHEMDIDGHNVEFSRILQLQTQEMTICRSCDTANMDILGSYLCRVYARHSQNRLSLEFHIWDCFPEEVLQCLEKALASRTNLARATCVGVRVPIGMQNFCRSLGSELLIMVKCLVVEAFQAFGHFTCCYLRAWPCLRRTSKVVRLTMVQWRHSFWAIWACHLFHGRS
mmetsp:Transcript_63763/g.113451  ORF Transcript_63763/g.113451 Transcript_63763/m.113451 type:complete len:437 (+) Transcript_63763:539-1849(+)